MNVIKYNVNSGDVCQIGRQYEYGKTQVIFEGYQVIDSANEIYFKFIGRTEESKYLIPIVDMTLDITQQLTKHVGQFSCQLEEMNTEGTLVSQSPVFYVAVKRSIKVGADYEVQDPRLETIYQKYNEMYNIISQTNETSLANESQRQAEWLTLKQEVSNAIDSFNADIAIGEFRTLVQTETDNFNTNAETKLNAYNQNDSQKTNTYNTNATEKLNAYNSNADNRVSEFNAQTEQIQADISGLKSDLAKWTRLDGVTIKDGTDLSPLIIKSGEHGYYSNNGVITPITYNDYKYFKLPIDGGNTYYLDNEFRWAFTTDADGNVVDSDNMGGHRITTSDNAVMLWVTYNKVNLPEYRKIAKGSSPTDTIFEIPSNVVLVNEDTDTDNISNGIVSKTGTFSASGDNILLSNARSNLRKGIRLVFEATVTSGTDFEIGFSISESSANTHPHNIISITSENISYNNVNYPHGLSITGRLQMLFEYLSNGSVDITLISNGNMFKQNVSFTMSNPAVPYVKSNGLIATDCKFTFICTDIRKKIWMFGDSYFAYSNARWTYYLKEYGYDNNVLLDGFPGMGSVNARVSFTKLLTLGKPSYAIWFMGMNDGTDTDDTTPNADWVTEKDNFITLCETNGIEPIFATIPNVPSINHKGKNKWIRESGYRYIDMCHAVGADVDVNWYGDMLSSDKIHPSESGAKALFAQVLLDLPEVMLDNL